MSHLQLVAGGGGGAGYTFAQANADASITTTGNNGYQPNRATSMQGFLKLLFISLFCCGSFNLQLMVWCKARNWLTFELIFAVCLVVQRYQW